MHRKGKPCIGLLSCNFSGLSTLATEQTSGANMAWEKGQIADKLTVKLLNNIKEISHTHWVRKTDNRDE